MTLPLAIFLLVVSLIVIAKSADLIVSTAVSLAHRLRVSEFNIGFFILGLATTTPELFVGLNAALSGEPQLSLGNLIGASIVLLSLIIGLNAVISGEVQFIKTFSKRDMWFTSFVILAPVFLLIDNELSRTDGVLLIFLYGLFYLVINKEQTFVEHIKYTFNKPHNHLGKTALIFIIGIFGLFVSSKLIVDSAQFIATSFDVPLVLIGLLLLSIGTNLPELTVLFISIRKQHKQIGIGDFLGSSVANTFVLGLVALLHPIILDEPLKVFLSLGMLFLTLVTFNAYFSLDKKINRLEGLSLIALYVFFLFAELFLKNRL